MAGEDFSDLGSEAPATAAPVAAPGTSSVSPADLSTQIHALLQSGASAASIRAYITAHGYAEPQGVDEAVAYRDKGGKGVNVVVNGQAGAPGTPPPTGDVAGGAPEDLSDLGTEAPPESTAGRQLGLGARATAAGLNSVADMANVVTAPVNAALDALGVPGGHPSAVAAGNSALDAVGAPVPVTDGEKLASAGVQGAASALPMIAFGGPMAAAPIAQTIGGLASGIAGEGARQSGAGPVAQLGASLVGGLAGAGGVAGIAGMAGRAPAVASPVMQAFDRQGIPALAADVGGTPAQMMTGATKMTLGGIPIAEAAQNTIAAARAARERIAGSIGQVADATGAGTAAQQGSRTFIANSENRGGQLYRAIPIAPDAPATLSNTRRALADLNAGLASNAELSAMLSDRRLRGYDAAITGTSAQVPTGLLDASGNPMMRTVQRGGALSWQDLQQFRTHIGELIGGPSMQSDTSQAALRRLYGALSEDMRTTAQATSPRALTAFNRANQYWRGRQARIDNVLTQILGRDMNTGAEAAFRQIQSWSSNTGDVARLATALRSLPADEAQTVRASIFNTLGDATPGAQAGHGGTFSPSTFVTQWNKMSPRAKAALFPGADYRQDIHDLVTATDAMKSAQKYNNNSHTGLAVNIAGHVGTFSAGLATGGLASIATAMSAAGEYGLGSLLASPRFARWLASSRTRPNAPAMLAHINRLSAIAAAEPAIASNLLHLQERLAGHFANDNSISSAVARPDQEKKGRAQ